MGWVWLKPVCLNFLQIVVPTQRTASTVNVWCRGTVLQPWRCPESSAAPGADCESLQPLPHHHSPSCSQAKGKWVGGGEQAAKLSLRKPLPAPWGQFQVPTPSPWRLTIGGEGLGSKGMTTEPRLRQTAPLAFLVQRLGEVRGILPLAWEEV